jgi:TetR/AcrR family transcriptional regulator, mexJK operon transcriptional repressor
MEAMIDTAAVAERPSPKGQQILAAAGRLFMAQGYGATSMDGVAREAGVSKATLYAHFAGKQELFAAIIGAACRRHAETLSTPDLEHHDLRDALRQIGREFLDLLLSPNAVAIYRIVIAEAPRFPELGRIFYASGPNIMLERLGGFIEAAAARRLLTIAEPRRAAEHFVCMLKGDIHLRYLLGLADAPGEHALAAHIDHAVEALLRAYRP